MKRSKEPTPAQIARLKYLLENSDSLNIGQIAKRCGLNVNNIGSIVRENGWQMPQESRKRLKNE